MTSEFNRFFKSKNLASTYKPTFLKCLLDIGDYENDEGSQWVHQKQNQYELLVQRGISRQNSDEAAKYFKDNRLYIAAMDNILTASDNRLRKLNQISIVSNFLPVIIFSVTGFIIVLHTLSAVLNLLG